MEKKISILFIILCLLSIAILKNYKISVKATQTWIVDDDEPADFKTIQEAINNASAGDTIFVRKGTYYENVVISKRIMLIGENRELTIIDGSNTESVIFISRADNVNVINFTITRSGSSFYNSSGILLEYSESSIIRNNLILTNYKGISLFYSSNNIICANNISNNLYDGISLYWSTNNIIKDNIISYNTEGISLYWSTSNVISANTIVNNPHGGIILAFSSDNNVIYHNNFNNVIQVWIYRSTNFWSYNGEGNYWSDYNGTDFYSGPNQDQLGSDGIGDVFYIIDETNIDKSPLMGMFFKFDITYKEEAHKVTIISNSTISDFQFQLGFETGNKIIRFKPIDNASTAGFCRVMFPIEFMSYPYILLVGNEEFSPSFLNISNETHVYLYFTYLYKNETITIISSEWYNELLNIYYDLNVTYHSLLNLYGSLLDNYMVLLDNYTQLRANFEQLNASYQYFYDLNVTFYNFLEDYVRLQENFNYLNETYWNLTNLHWQLQMNFGNLSITYQSLLNTLVLFSGNYTQLLEDFQELNASYQEHLRSYSENVSNVKSITYILAAWAAILIVVTAYLSKRVYGSSGAQKIKTFGKGYG